VPLLRHKVCSLIAATVLVAACSSDADDAADSDGSDAASAEDLTLIADAVENDLSTAPIVAGAPLNPYDLRSGQCFNEGSWYDEERERRIEMTASIGCDQPHNKEVFHEAIFPAPSGAPFPGETKMTEWSTELCYSAFEDFVGLEYELSVFEITFIQPTEATFEHPVGQHRRVTCVLFDGTTDQKTGSARAAGV